MTGPGGGARGPCKATPTGAAAAGASSEVAAAVPATGSGAGMVSWRLGAPPSTSCKPSCTPASLGRRSCRYTSSHSYTVRCPWFKNTGTEIDRWQDRRLRRYARTWPGGRPGRECIQASKQRRRVKKCQHQGA